MQTLEQALQHAAIIRRAAGYLTDERIRELHRRCEHKARDGYAASVRGGSSRGPDVPDPVLAYVTADDPPDLVMRWVTEGMAGLNESAGALSAVVGSFENALRVEAENKGRQASGGTCQACGAWHSGAEEDRLKSGYGPDCYMAWTRAGRPDRLRFENERRGRKAS